MISTLAADLPAPALAATAPEGGGELIDFPTGRYAIPDEDMVEFTTAVRLKEQERIKLVLSFIARMEAGGIVATSENLAFQLRNVPGYSAGNLRALYYKWKAHGWRGLRRNFCNGGGKLPGEFIVHFRALTEQNGRSIRQAMNALYRAWYAGESIPGYGTWREWFWALYPDREIPAACPRVPDGWKQSNLYTLQPTEAQRALKTKGFAAAKKHLLSIVRDPSRLLPLQLIVIDDFEIDQYCVVRGRRQLCKMVGLAAMDVATRRILALVLKPRLTDDEGKQQAITRAEVRLLLFQLLRDHGIPAHGLTVLCEKAAAAVTAELETTFRNLFGGRVCITRTTTLDGKVLSEGFRETGGKPWLKGWIESFFNLLHNVAAGVATGDKGRNYIHKPADLEQRMRVAERLLGTGRGDARLTEEQVSRVRLPFQSPEELCDLYLRIFRWIEDRTDHQLLGFDQVQEWRAHQSEAPRPWADLAKLSPEAMATVEILPLRMESPRERWAKLYPRIQRSVISDYVLMMLLLTPKEAKRTGYKVSFAHNGTGYTWVIPPRAALAEDLRDGGKCLCYFDPANAHTAHLATLDGRYLSEVTRWGSIDITNPEACTEAERELARLYAEVRATVAERPLHQAENARLAEDRAVNAAIVAEGSLSLKKALTRSVANGEATTATGEDFARQVLAAKAEDAQRKAHARAYRTADTASLTEIFCTPSTLATATADERGEHNPGADLL